MMNKPLCFVLMPSGKKTDAAGETVDFDRVYQEIIAPAIAEAGLESLRSEEEMSGGIIHKPTFERLILCEYAVADLMTASGNVFYALGLRHAVRPRATVLIFAEGGRLLFDVSAVRALPYKLDKEGVPSDPATDKAALQQRLSEARREATGNQESIAGIPLYQLLEDFTEVAHTKTDVFRDRVQYSKEIKGRLMVAREQGVEAIRQIENELGEIEEQESAAVIDLYLSYRSVKAWDSMIALVDKMSRPLAATVMVQEQYALALNRAGRGEEAEKVLTDLLARRRPSSETLGVLGRVYKDRWEAADKAGEKQEASTLLDQAIDAYLRGFEADWRDAFPGINAVTLMEIKDPPDPRREKILPVVLYAVEQRIAKGQPDYWDYATLLELAVLAKDEPRARAMTAQALAAVRETWEPETTIRNLRLIREARERRQEASGWVKQIEEALAGKAK